MIRTFALLTLRSFKNRFLRAVRRLREPRYLVSTIAALFYFWFMVFRRMMVGGRAPMRMMAGDFAADATGVVILGILLIAWALPDQAGGIEFSESEIAFLFPAPLTRGQLLLYKVFRMQPRILISALIVTLIGLRAGKFVGLWLLFTTLSIYFMTARIARARLKFSGIGFLVRLPIVLLLVALAVWILRADLIDGHTPSIAARANASDGTSDLLPPLPAVVPAPSHASAGNGGAVEEPDRIDAHRVAVDDHDGGLRGRRRRQLAGVARQRRGLRQHARDAGLHDPLLRTAPLRAGPAPRPRADRDPEEPSHLRRAIADRRNRGAAFRRRRPRDEVSHRGQCDLTWRRRTATRRAFLAAARHHRTPLHDPDLRRTAPHPQRRSHPPAGMGDPLERRTARLRRHRTAPRPLLRQPPRALDRADPRRIALHPRVVGDASLLRRKRLRPRPPDHAVRRADEHGGVVRNEAPRRANRSHRHLE